MRPDSMQLDEHCGGSLDKWVCLINNGQAQALHVQVAEQQGKYLACMIKWITLESNLT